MEERFLNKYVENKCSDEEFKSALDLLLAKDKWPVRDVQMKQHWNKTTNEGEHPDLTGTLYKIHYSINKNEKVKKLEVVDYLLRIAAILILPLTLALVYYASDRASSEAIMQTITSPLASRSSFDLPDGSKVWLNSGSTIHFPTQFSSKMRKVELEGQAYFDVKKDNTPFEVVTNSFKVNVHGTSFDVDAYNGEPASVTLVNGKVAIENLQGMETFLDPGEQVTVDAQTGKLNKQEVDINVLTAWKDNLLIFKDEPFEDAVLRLERWYGIDIDIADEAINYIRLTGTFQFEGISEILQLLEITDDIKYSYDEKTRKLILKLR
jgi:ferric-dicitrate binding protein FerR (iron transport regulator)